MVVESSKQYLAEKIKVKGWELSIIQPAAVSTFRPPELEGAHV